jgi:hypothetical protein
MPKGNEQWVQRIDISRLEEGVVSLTGNATSILSNQTHYPADDRPGTIEGPWMIKRGGKYILFSASAYRNIDPMEYWTEVAVSDNLFGPYTVYPKIYPGGHIGVFTGPDNKDWLSARGEKREQTGFTELNISPIPFTGDWIPASFPLQTGTQSVTWEQTGGINRYPDEIINPVRIDHNGNIFVSFPDRWGKTVVSVYDFLGKKWLSKESANEDSVFIGNLPKGIYFLQIAHKEKHSSYKIII